MCGIAPARRAIRSVSTLHATTRKRITALVWAVAVRAAADAAATIVSAERAERRVFALAIFIASVADAASFIAAVELRRAGHVVAAAAQAAIAERVAVEIVVAISGLQALDAALALQVTAKQRARGAVLVRQALVAFTGGAVQTRRACWMDAAGTAAGGAARRRCASRCHRSRSRTGPTSAARATAADAAVAACRAAGVASPASAGSASASCAPARPGGGRGYVESKAIVARRLDGAHGQQKRRARGRPGHATHHGPSWRASSTAKPLG